MQKQFMQKKMRRRMAAVVMSVCMAFSLFPPMVFAESGGGGQTYLCGHVHDESCGYQAAVEAQPCGHEMEGGAYTCAPIISEDGYTGEDENDEDVDVGLTSPSNADERKASPSNGTEKGKDSDSDSDIDVCDHTDGCGYAEAVEGKACTHTCALCEAVADGNVDAAKAAKAVIDQIDDLPTTDSIYAEIPGEEDPEFAAWLSGMQRTLADIHVAKAAYDALSEDAQALVAAEGDAEKLMTLATWAEMMAQAMPMDNVSVHVTTEAGLSNAINNASTDSETPTIIAIDSAITVNEDIKIIGKNIKLTGKTLKKKSNFSGNLIMVMDSAKLTLENITVDGGGVDAGGGHLVKVDNGSTLIMNDGAELKDNVKEFLYGTVYINNGCNFIMNGGSITGNTAYSGGAVYIESTGSFTMTGGKITGNYAENYGGGVYNSGGAFTVGGDAVIKDNTKIDGPANNVQLANAGYITLGAAPATGMAIHVNGVAEQVIMENGANETIVEYFHADNSSLEVVHDNGKLKLKAKTAVVAKIGETEYTSLQAAFDAVQDSQTIQLCSAITFSDSISTGAGNKNFTFCIGSHVLTYKGSSSAIVHNGSGLLTIQGNDMGGALYAEEENATAISNEGTGTVSIQNVGVVTTTGTTIRNISAGTISVKGTGGVVATTGIAIKNESTGKIIVDATVESQNTTTGTIYISAVPTGGDDKVVLDVQGGTVSGSKYAVFFASSSGVTADNLSQYYRKANGATVGNIYFDQSPVATIDGVGYPTLAAAFASVQAGESKTIKVVKDVTFGTSINTGTDKKDITLDLNGKVLEYDRTYVSCISHQNRGTLTITDTDSTGKGRILTGNGCMAIYNLDGGTVHVTGGEISAPNGVTIYNDDGAVNITGGKVLATNGCAIYSGRTGRVTIGNEAVVESQNTGEYDGTIQISGVPNTGDKLVLDIQGGTVRNTAASGPNYAVCFANSTRVTSDNISQYYRQSSSANVGKVHPEPHFIYSIALDPGTDKDFGTATRGYGEQTPHVVTVTNGGNQPTGDLKVALSGANAGSFTLSKTAIGSLEAGDSESISVKPNTGMAAGTYEANVTVSGGSGILAGFAVKFTVTAPSNSGGGGGGNSSSTSASTTGGAAPTALRKTADATGHVTVTAVVPQETVMNELQNPELGKVSVDVVVLKSVENSQMETFTGITIEKGIVDAVRQTGKWLETIVKDEKGAIEAVWSLNGQTMKAAAGESTDLTLGVHTAPVQSEDVIAVPVKSPVTATGHENGLVLTVTANGALLSGAKLTVPATGKTDIAAGTAVTLYQFDANTGTLRAVPGGAYTVDANGYVTIDLSAGTRMGAAETYVLLANGAAAQNGAAQGQTGAAGGSAVPGSSGTHTIAKGDTLNDISRRYGCTVQDLLALNPGVDIYDLRIGSSIVVPGR